MNRILAVIGLAVGLLSRPGWCAPTDPSHSGTMDVANDRDDTSADVNEHRVLKEDNASTHQKELRARSNRRSPKIDPSTEGSKVDAGHPAPGAALNAGVSTTTSNLIQIEPPIPLSTTTRKSY